MQIFKIQLLFILFFFLIACDMQKYPEAENGNRPEVLIYSGITMIQPLKEISALIEQSENCRIKIIYGGSSHLLKSIEINQIGDLFFPGDQSYIDILQEKGIITESVIAGYNQAGLFVQTGNPDQITSDLNNLQNKHLKIVIGSRKAGSIGHETEKILRQAGIYQAVLDNSLYMTTDSKGLAEAIKNKDADLVLNWKAVHFLPENLGKMTFIKLPSKSTKKQPLVLGLLTYSQYPEISKKFMQLTVSATGKNIFHKYGFQD